MLSVKETAEILHISKPTVIRFIKQGKLKAVRIGNVFKVDSEDVERILKHGS